MPRGSTDLVAAHLLHGGCVGFMGYGFRFVWTDEALPGDGPVMAYNRHGNIAVLCHRPTFREEPERFMADLEAHLDHQTQNYMRMLTAAQAS